MKLPEIVLKLFLPAFRVISPPSLLFVNKCSFRKNSPFRKKVENLDKFLQRFWAVFEPRDDGYPHLAPKRPFSKICNQYKFFQKIIPFFLISTYFSRYPILEKTKRDIGKIKRAIVSTKREIISTKRALVAIKRALGATPSPLPRGGEYCELGQKCDRKDGYKGV